MQRHMNLVTPNSAVCLPIAGRTADRLAAALIDAHEGPADFEAVRQALAGDAPLAVWALCRAAATGASEPRTVEELAAWLAPRLLDALAAPAEIVLVIQHTAGSSLAGSCDELAQLAAQSLTIAKLAKQCVAHEHLARPAGDQAYLLGLVQAAPRWLELAGGDRGSSVRALPGWLQDALRQLDAASPGGVASLIGSVAAARDAIGQGTSTGLPAPILADFQVMLAQLESLRAQFAEPPRLGSLAALVERLSRLAALETHFAQTLEHEKLESLKELAYGAGHEINNPLANISARAQTLLAGEPDPERRRLLAAINAQAFRAHEMITDMMLFARPPQPKLEPVELASLVRGVQAELEPQAIAQRTELAVDVPDGAVTIRADATQLAVALRALVVNALEALVTGGRVELALVESASFDDPVQITVTDDGPGISAEARRHLFDPFFSGREAGRGLGFGLSKCWRIVTAHGGRIEVDSPTGGARFTIELPRDPARR